MSRFLTLDQAYTQTKAGAPSGTPAFVLLLYKSLSRQASLITSVTHLVIPSATWLMRVPNM